MSGTSQAFTREQGPRAERVSRVDDGEDRVGRKSGRPDARFARGLLRDVAATVGTRFSLIALGLGTSILVARSLGPEGRGLFAVAATITGMGVQVTNLGLHASNTYAVSKDRGLLGSLVANSLVASVVLGVLVAMLVAVLALAVPHASPVSGPLLGLAVVSIPIGLAYLLLQNLLLGMQDVRAYNFVDIAARGSGVLLITLFLVAGATSVELLFLATVLSSAGVVVWAAHRLIRSANGVVRPRLSTFHTYWRYGLRAYAAALLAYLVLRVDVLLIQYIRGPQDAGYYALAVSLFDILYLVPVVVGSLMFPRLLQMPRAERRHIATAMAVRIGAAMAGVAVIAAFLAAPAIQLLYGDDFLPAYLPFVWLLPALVALSVHTIAMNYFATLDNPLVIVYAPAVGLLLNIAANVALVPSFGVVGASIASVLAYGAMLCISLAYLRTGATA